MVIEEGPRIAVGHNPYLRAWHVKDLTIEIGNCSGRFGGVRQEGAAVESATKVFEDGQAVFTKG